MATPIFKISDIVYLLSSAKFGFLEAYQITAMHQITSNKWVYKIAITASNTATATVGDAIDVRRQGIAPLYFNEAELLTYCEASLIQIDTLQRRLAAATAQRNGRCE